MAHARQQIRGAVETLLTGLTTTGSNIYASRVYPMETLPCLAVYTLSESVVDTTLEGHQTRNLTLIVEGRAKVVNTLDDTLDTIAEEVETVLNTDAVTGVDWVEYQETEIELFDDLEKPSGVIRLFFNMQYRIDVTDPSTLID